MVTEGIKKGESIVTFHFWTFINVHFQKPEILLGKNKIYPIFDLMKYIFYEGKT
jgi:hypothetical protein